MEERKTELVKLDKQERDLLLDILRDFRIGWTRELTAEQSAESADADYIAECLSKLDITGRILVKIMKAESRSRARAEHPLVKALQSGGKQ